MGTISSGIIEVRSQSDFAVIEAKVPSVSCFFSREKDLSATYNNVPLDYYVLENLKKEIPFFGFLHYEYDDSVDMSYTIVWSTPGEEKVHLLELAREDFGLNPDPIYHLIKDLPCGSLQWLTETNAWDYYALFQLASSMPTERRLLLYRLFLEDPDASFDDGHRNSRMEYECHCVCRAMMDTGVIDGYHTAKKLLEQYDSGAVPEDFRTDWDQFVTYSMWVVGEIDDVLDEMRDGGQSDWEKECHISHQKSKPVQRRKPNEVEVKPIRYAEKVQLVGTQFEGRAERIEHVHKGDTVMLVREPENPYDTNAIDVRSPEGSLGHIGAELTPRYACLLDSGSMRCEGRIAEVTPLSMRSSKCKKALVTIRVYPAKKQK